MSKLKLYLKNDKKHFICTAPLTTVYIPTKYFDTNISKFLGSTIITFGLLNCKVFDLKGNVLCDEMLNLPTEIHLYPSVTERVNMDDESYIAAKFYSGDRLTDSVVRQNLDAVEGYLNYLLTKKISRSVKYSDIMRMWERNMELNGKRLGVPAVIYELIVSELYRGGKNINVPYRLDKAKHPNLTEYDYVPITIREVCSRSSVFTALTFEDFDYMVTSSLNMSKSEAEQADSPVEKIIKM